MRCGISLPHRGPSTTPPIAGYSVRTNNHIDTMARELAPKREISRSLSSAWKPAGSVCPPTLVHRSGVRASSTTNSPVQSKYVTHGVEHDADAA